MSRKISMLPLSRGEKRWVGSKADECVGSLKMAAGPEVLENLQLADPIRWTFGKEEAGEGNFLYQAGYHCGPLHIRYWVTADPCRNFSVTNMGFNVTWGHSIIYTGFKGS